MITSNDTKDYARDANEQIDISGELRDGKIKGGRSSGIQENDVRIIKFKKENHAFGNLSENPKVFRRERGIFKNRLTISEKNKKEKNEEYGFPNTVLKGKISLKYLNILVSGYKAGVAQHGTAPVSETGSLRGLRVQNFQSGNPVPGVYCWNKKIKLLYSIHVPDNFNSIIDDIRIYNRSFSASEAADLYNGAKSNHLSYSKSEGSAIPQTAGNLSFFRVISPISKIKALNHEIYHKPEPLKTSLFVYNKHGKNL